MRALLRPCLAAMAPTLLFAPRTWCLQPGAFGAPAVLRLLAPLLLLALALLSGGWLLAIGQDVWRGGRSVWVLLPCASLVWWLWRQLRSAWGRWHSVPAILSLSWAGEVQSDPPTGGWRLGGLTGVPADVRCLLDAQGWLLCRIRCLGEGASAAAVHWCWIDARRCPDMHRFRTLMSLPARLTTAVRGGEEAHAPAMASWALRRHPSGIALRGSTDTFMPTQPLVAWGEAAGPAGKDRS